MKHILVVDDDVIMNNSIKAMLSDAYRVSQLTSGTQVMDFLHLKETDLVLLDMYMHDMDGMEVLRRMKADDTTSAIPVIFLTGEDSVDVEAECLHLGAADYVHKPISRQVLEQRVSNHLMAAESFRRVRQMYENANHEAVTSRQIIQHDELTGLWNRQHIYEAYSESMREDGARCALAFIDMDNFKYINDIFGHQEGDALLRRFAAILRGLEDTGVVPARIGGDEFLILLPGHNTPGTVQDLSDYIFEKSSKQVLPSSEPGAVTFSMGVAFSPDDGSDFESTAAMADMALQKAKSLGKNRVYFAKNLNILARQRELEVNNSMTPLEHVLEVRRSDKDALVIQFGELRILYRCLKNMPEDISGNIRAVMFTVAPEDSNPFDTGRLMHAVSESMPGISAITKYAQNQIVALSYGIEREELISSCADITASGGYGRVTVEVI
jgi:diguanylate cyclase (GGDEF)-like protein